MRNSIYIFVALILSLIVGCKQQAGTHGLIIGCTYDPNDDVIQQWQLEDAR